MTAVSSTPGAGTTVTLAQRRPDLVAGLCGLSATLLAFVASPPEEPATTSTAAVRAWVEAEAGALRTCGVAMALSGVLLLVLLARLRARMIERAPQVRWIVDAGVSAGLLCAVWLLVAGAGYAVLGLDGADAADAELVGFLGFGAFADTLGTLATPAKAALLICVSVAALLSRGLPGWLGWSGLALGVVTAGSMVGVAGESVVAVIAFHLGLFAFALWPGLAGVTLAVRAGR